MKKSDFESPVTTTPERQFLGKTENFENSREKAFHQRMLKAYLAGHKFFHFGYEYIFSKRQPKQYLVLQKTT